MRCVPWLLWGLLTACGKDAQVDTGPSAEDTAPAESGVDGGADSAQDSFVGPQDMDGDGYTEEEDCDDGDASVYPGATELPYDNIDQDCDGSDLDDLDQDGWSAVEAGGEDCDDTDPAINPDAEDPLGDGIDQNCNGSDRAPLVGRYSFDDSDVYFEGTVVSENFSETFGWAVLNSADLNSDGLDDVIIGDPWASSANVMIYHAPFDSYIDAESEKRLEAASIWGEEPNHYMGYSLAAAGDVDNSGYDSVWIGTQGDYPYCQPTIQDCANRVYRIRGSVTGEGDIYNMSVATLYGGNLEWNLGAFVAADGDLNADGRQDLLVSAYSYGYAAYAVTQNVVGSVDLEDVMAASFTYANAIAHAGDVNGDGFGDVVAGWYFFIGTKFEDSPDVGATVFLGPTTGELPYSSADHVLRRDPSDDYDYSTIKVSSAGDVNDDGYSDILVGSPYYRSEEKGDDYSYGRVYLLYGPDFGSNALNEADVVFNSGGLTSSLGRALEHGNLDHDPYSDIILADIGAVHTKEEANAFLFYGPLEPGHYSAASADAVFADDSESQNYAARSLSARGDNDGDGYYDLMIGEPYCKLVEKDKSHTTPGCAHIFYGAPR
jgi:hypothetical protein